MTLFTDKLSGAMMQELVNITGYCVRTIRNVWKEFTNQRSNAFDVPVDLEPKINGHSGKRRRADSDEIQQGIKTIITSTRPYIL
jgi:hypothetical protein